MKVTRMYSGDDGQTHFEDIEVELSDRGKDKGKVSTLEPATGIIFRRTEGNYDYDWHNAPRRQYIIPLDGQVEITIGDGSKRVFGPGQVLLAEDTDGKGHISRAVSGMPRNSIFVTLD